MDRLYRSQEYKVASPDERIIMEGKFEKDPEMTLTYRPRRSSPSPLVTARVARLRKMQYRLKYSMNLPPRKSFIQAPTTPPPTPRPQTIGPPTWSQLIALNKIAPPTAFQNLNFGPPVGISEEDLRDLKVEFREIMSYPSRNTLFSTPAKASAYLRQFFIAMSTQVYPNLGNYRAVVALRRFLESDEDVQQVEQVEEVEGVEGAEKVEKVEEGEEVKDVMGVEEMEEVKEVEEMEELKEVKEEA